MNKQHLARGLHSCYTLLVESFVETTFSAWLAQAKSFRWVTGMLCDDGAVAFVTQHSQFAIVGYEIEEDGGLNTLNRFLHHKTPNLEDAGTCGHLLSLVQNLKCDPTIHLEPVEQGWALKSSATGVLSEGPTPGIALAIAVILHDDGELSSLEKAANTIRLGRMLLEEAKSQASEVMREARLRAILREKRLSQATLEKLRSVEKDWDESLTIPRGVQ